MPEGWAVVGHGYRERNSGSAMFYVVESRGAPAWKTMLSACVRCLSACPTSLWSRSLTGRRACGSWSRSIVSGRHVCDAAGHRYYVCGDAEEVARQIHDNTHPDLAAAWVAEITRDFTDAEAPSQVRRLGRAIGKWAAQIVVWLQAHASNGSTETVNNLVERVRRTALGFRSFERYRIRTLLYADKPTGSLLDTLTSS